VIALRIRGRGPVVVMLLAGLLLAAGCSHRAAGPDPTATDASTTESHPSAALTPPLGWNTWNTFGCNINEALIRRTADAMVSNGMRAAGYRYVVVDDCWFDPDRDAKGNLQSDPDRFPRGMKALGDYVHARGLKFGLYQVPTEKTCAQRAGTYPGSTGSQGHETQDADQFAAWGVDYVKYDWCSPAGTMDEQVTAFARMRDALQATGRPIVFSINPNSFHTRKTGRLRNWGDVADLWRTTDDITTAWDTSGQAGFRLGVKNIVDLNTGLAGYAAPGRFNDPDMLEVGNGGLTDTEMRSHFALWAVMAAPLMAGNDPRSATKATTDLLTNRTLLAINQDRLGLQAWPVSNDGTRRVLAKRLADGDIAVALFNQGSSTTKISTTAAALGLAGTSFTRLDAWTGARSTSSGTFSASVAAHDTVVYRISGGSIDSTHGRAVVGAAANRCLDGSENNGSGPVIQTCAETASQRWSAPNGTRQTLGRCLDAQAGLQTCTGGTYQQWTTTDGPIRNVRTGLCLETAANTTGVFLRPCNGQLNQQWTTRP
jgi:alpha-galactosidase